MLSKCNFLGMQVADNTLVNTHPILTGELYRGAVTSVFEGMSAAERKRKGRYPIEESHFFWKRMNGAASLWVSDPRWDMYFYPARVAGGPCRPITHFYLRPYMHQWLTLRNYSMTRCVSYHNARQTLNLTRLWLQRFKDTYHFTFSKIMMLLHHHTGNGGTLSSVLSFSLPPLPLLSSGGGMSLAAGRTLGGVVVGSGIVGSVGEDGAGVGG